MSSFIPFSTRVDEEKRFRKSFGMVPSKKERCLSVSPSSSMSFLCSHPRGHTDLLPCRRVYVYVNSFPHTAEVEKKEGPCDIAGDVLYPRAIYMSIQASASLSFCKDKYVLQCIESTTGSSCLLNSLFFLLFVRALFRQEFLLVPTAGIFISA